MALKGNLKDFSTTQLLNLINLARKTGLLSIEEQGTTAKLFFREGKLIYASLGDQNEHLTNMLLKAGKISADQAKAIQSRSEVNTDKELGLLLINAGYITQDDIVQSVKSHMLEVVYALFTWVKGMFRFDPNVLPSEDKITVPISLENVIMEGSRRVKEWERLQEELPDLNLALKFTDHPDAKLRNINLSVEEWRVISFINPRNTIKQIAQSNNMSDFQIRKIVYGMLQAGLVEIVAPEGVEPRRPSVSPGRRPSTDQPPAVKRSVVLRLIDRIKRI